MVNKHFDFNCAQSQARIKQRTRDAPGIHNRWKQIDPPWRPEDDYLLIHSLFVVSQIGFWVYASMQFILRPVIWLRFVLASASQDRIQNRRLNRGGVSFFLTQQFQKHLVRLYFICRKL